MPDESISLRDYIDALIDALKDRIHINNESYIREVQATAHALTIQTNAADAKLMDYMAAQRESVKSALEALKELLAQKDREVTATALSIQAAQSEFKDQILERLEILNGHDTEVSTLVASFVAKEMFFELRDAVREIDARSIENARKLALTSESGTDQILVKQRLEQLEMRPLAMTPEEQGETKSAIRESARSIERIHTDFHDLRNAMQTMPVFSASEIDDMRRLAKAVTKADVQELLTDIEVKGLRRVLEGKGSKMRRFGLIEAAVISAGTFSLLSGLVVLVTKLFHG